MNFNDSQKAAIDHINGPCLVLAGAGSGKTRVITGRIENLINKHGVLPKNILAVTFTNKAAREMEDRIHKTLYKRTEGLTCCTFHALGVRILRQKCKILGLKRNFSIYTGNETMLLIKKAMHNLQIPEEMFEPRLVHWKISQFKSKNLSPDKVVVLDPLTSVARRVMGEYQKLLLEYNAVDFDDLLNHTLTVLENEHEFLEQLQSKYEYILVDEFQDTNIIQYKIIRLLADKHKNLFVVGDDDQSIYGFRGANYENILLFDKDWPNCKTIVLNVNYRSNRTILNAASAVIGNNTYRKVKEVSSFDASELPIEYSKCIDDKDEANYIADKILEIHPEELSEVAVLMRANHQSRVLEEAFREKRIPYNLVGGLKFYDRKEIKDVLAYLTVLGNPSDEVAMLRIINTPRRGIGEETIFKIGTHAKKHKQPFFESLQNYKEIPEISDTIHYNLGCFLQLVNEHRDMLAKDGIYITINSLVEASGYYKMLEEEKVHPKAKEAKKENIGELLNSIYKYEKEAKIPTVEKYLDKISLLQDMDDDDGRNVVTIMTVHSSKGLEFGTVFICGFEDGIFPHQKSIEEENIEEERRLCYVAITRAKSRLFITMAGERKRFKDTINPEPSRFLREIPEELFLFIPKEAQMKQAERAKAGIQELMAKIQAKYKE